MPLGAEDVQATELDDLVVLRGDRGLSPFQGLRPGGLVFLRRLGRVETTLGQIRDCDEFGVACLLYTSDAADE